MGLYFISTTVKCPFLTAELQLQAPMREIFTIKFLCRVAGLKVHGWCYYVFSHCVVGRVSFKGGIFIWALSS